MIPLKGHVGCSPRTMYQACSFLLNWTVGSCGHIMAPTYFICNPDYLLFGASKMTDHWVASWLIYSEFWLRQCSPWPLPLPNGGWLDFALRFPSSLSLLYCHLSDTHISDFFFCSLFFICTWFSQGKHVERPRVMALRSGTEGEVLHTACGQLILE